MKKDKIVELEITSWQGVSLGAEHYYGKLRGYFDDDFVSVEVEAKMTQRQAVALGKKDDWHHYKAGSMTSRFDTKEEVETTAILTFKDKFPNASVLLKGHWAAHEPKKCLSADDLELMDNLNKVFIEYDKIKYRDTEEYWNLVDPLADKFYTILKNKFT